VNYKKCLLCAIAVYMILTGYHAAAQSEAFRKGSDALKEGNRLLAIEYFRKAVIENPQWESLLYQNLPLISDYTPIHAFESTTLTPIKNAETVEAIKNKIESYEFLDAVSQIVDLAKQRRIVILNEGHDSPQHRAFGHLLARELRTAGFNYLAVETLALVDGNAGIVTFDYPTVETGHYSAEPVFGDFLRQANSMGYKMVSYEINPNNRKAKPEDQYGGIIERETIQAENLIKHVLDKDDDSKLFVYVGYSHATEHWNKLADGRELGWLAAQIQRKTGIDPLTIDQVGGSYNPKSKSIDPVFSIVQKHTGLSSPKVAKLKEGNYLVSDQYTGKVDMTVFHPVQKMIDGRPNWLSMNGYRKPFVIQNADVFVENPTLVQAFVISETVDAIPVDQLLLDSAQGQSTLLLPPGKYRINASTSDGKNKLIREIEITQ
jgi:hypothetical protein